MKCGTTKAYFSDEILDALDQIPDLRHDNYLEAYGMMNHDDRVFKALLDLPLNIRNDWLFMEIKNEEVRM
jgi:hypothetical protein